MTNARAIRQRINLGQRAAARLIGITSAELSRLEAGKVNPTLATLRKIAQAYGVTVGELVDPEPDLS